jgi:PAS domain S-box-containing protein
MKKQTKSRIKSPEFSDGSIDLVENELLKERDQLKIIIDLSPTSIWFKDTKNNFISINKAAAKIANCAVKDVEGHSADEIFPIESSNYYKDDLEVIQTGKPKLGIIESATTDGITTWVRTDKIPWYDADGNIAGIVAFALDITDNIRAQRKLQSSETRYRRLFESAKDGILILDGESGQIDDVNPFLIELLGYSKEEFLDKKVWEIGIFKDIFENIDKYEELKKTGYVRYENLPLETKDGRHINVEFVSNVYIADNKKVIQCNIRDITDSAHAEEALQTSRKEFQAYFDSGSVGLSVTAADKTWIEVNQRLCKMLGYTKEELIGLSWNELSHPADLVSNLKLFQQALDGKIDNYELDKRFIRKDGSILYVSLSVVCQRNNDGSVHHFLSSYIDITERKRAEESIRESEDRYHNLLNAAPVGIAVYSDGKFVFINPAGLKLLGAESDDQLLEKPINEIIHPEELEKSLDRFQRMIAGESGLYPSRDKYIRLDGKVIDVEVIASLLIYNDNPSVQVIVTDITDRKKAEREIFNSREQLRALNARLEKVQEEERIKLSRELHDNLGQNLTGLKMDVAWLAKRIKGEITDEPQVIISKTESMLELIDDIIKNIRRVSAELRPNGLDYLGLIPTIEWQIEEYRKRTELQCEFTTNATNINFKPEINSSIFRIFQEAFTNIIRHSKATNVTINILEETDTLRLEISDNGIGINEALLSDDHSLGIIGMKERTLQFNGELNIEKISVGGTKLTLFIPKPGKN